MDLLFLKVCKNLEIPEPIATKWLQKIQDKLSSEKQRHYHNWNNFISSKYKFVENLDNACVVLAIFFQYYEFDCRRNCVDENCLIFQQFVEECGLNDEVLVKKTKKLLGDVSIEDQNGYDEDFDLLQDLNLTVLGASNDKYKVYTELLRKEYSHLDNKAYKDMRLKILETFLVIPQIYSNKQFMELEDTARTNIKNEIKELKI